MLSGIHARSLRAVPLIAVIAIALAVTVDVAAGQQQAPPPEPFQKVSTLVELPDFVPGLGVLYVDPATLPAGPFLAYDRTGNLVSTIYMIPLSSMRERQVFNGLAVASAPVRHVDVNYNAGHPGLPEPHYHVVLWHVSKAEAAALK